MKELSILLWSVCHMSQMNFVVTKNILRIYKDEFCPKLKNIHLDYSYKKKACILTLFQPRGGRGSPGFFYFNHTDVKIEEFRFF